jgi:integrase|nr:site-specific integrase [Alistipes onderdonkii]
MTSLKLRLNTCRVLRDGTYPLVFQLIHQRRKKLIYTSYRLRKEEFDIANDQVRYLSEDVRSKREVCRINRMLISQRHDIEKHIKVLEQRREPYRVDDVLFCYQVERDGLSLLHYIDLQISRKQALGKFGTAAALRHMRISVATFMSPKIVRLTDIDGSFVREYEEFLLYRGVSQNTVCYYMRNLKSIYNQAISEGYLTNSPSPFRWVRSHPQNTVKRALDYTSLRKIVELPLTNQPHLELARDLFLFSFFSRGMPFVDIVFLKRSDIRDGVIYYIRRKTNQSMQVTVTPQLKHLIQKYAGNSEYLFPLLSGSDKFVLHKCYRLALERVNRNLKIIGEICKITMPLTTYVARHSWATLAKMTGAPLAVISEGLGHTSEKTTRIYLKQFDRSVVDWVNEQVSALR